MNQPPINDMEFEEEIVMASRRKFLKNLVCGSLVALSGTGTAAAAVRHAIHPGRHRHTLVPAKSRHSFARRDQSHIVTPHSSLHAYDFKTLAFEHTHTGDKLKLTYFERGRYIKEALQEINYLLRDFRTDDIHPIDTALLDQLFVLKQMLGVNRPFHIISGYRSPLTNAQLRKNSHGVAEHSFHMQGRAIDIRLERVSPKTIRNAALKMAQGGVGYYPRDNFVHLDTGRVRSW